MELFPIGKLDNLNLISKKVEKLNNLKKKRLFNLPSTNYGPICLKILHDFIEHHKIIADLPMPTSGLKTHEALSRIFDIIIHSMGNEKQEEYLKNLDEYNHYS
jgi:hypothetical protein